MPTFSDHLRAVREQVLNAHGQVVVGVEQAGRGGDDAVAIVISVAAPGDVEF